MASGASEGCEEAAHRIVAAAVVKSGVVGPEGIVDTAEKYADSEPGVETKGSKGCSCGAGGWTEGENNALRTWRGVFPLPPVIEGGGKGIRISFVRGEEDPTLARRWLMPVRGEMSGGREAESSGGSSGEIGIDSSKGPVASPG